MKCNIILQKNNYLKSNLILKIFSDNNKFVCCYVGNLKNIEKILRTKYDILLSENFLLSVMFLKDLIIEKIENGFIYL